MKEKGMKILYLNAMGPTENFEQGGIFVTQRIKTLMRLDVQVIPVSSGIEYSYLVKKILALKNIPTAGKLLKEQAGVCYKVITTKLNLIDMFGQKINPFIHQNKIFKAIEKGLKNEKDIDLIHLHWFWPIGLGVKKYSAKYDIPYVITCHGSEINVTMQNPRLRTATVDILENAKKVEFVSLALLNRAKSFGYSGKNAEVVYNGIDTSIFNVQHIEQKAKVVGFVGNLIPIKGVDRLPEIFGKIKQKYTGNVTFTVVGKGSMEDELKHSTEELSIKFTGQLTQAELAAEYAKMNVLVVPSREEGYSCAIKEAQACGVIPVGNNVGGIKEAISDFGMLITADSEEKLIEQFADAVVKCLTGAISFDISEMVRKAREESWECKQKESVNLYKTIVGL